MKFFKQFCFFSCALICSIQAMNNEECTDKIEKNEENLALLAQQALQIEYSIDQKNILHTNNNHIKVCLDQDSLDKLFRTKFSLYCNNKSIISFDTYLKKLVEWYNDAIFIHQINVLLPLETFCLRRLQLSHNKISTLPASFTSLNTLEDLDLSDNEFKKFPPEICAFVSLTHLWLNKNKIEGTLPIAQGDLPNLEELNLEENQKITFSKACVHLTNLKKLTYDKDKVTIEYPNHSLLPKEDLLPKEEIVPKKPEKKEGIFSKLFSKK